MAFQVLNASSIGGAAPPLALKQRVGKSATLDHFNDKIDTVCITLAQEVQNASKCLAPAAYDLRVKSMSFQRVLEYYIMEINVFRSTWKTALKQFTDTADTFVENPLGASLLEEASMFGHKAPLDGVPRINVIDKDAAIKEFETPWEGNKKIVPDARDMNLGPNVDQTTGHEIDSDEKPMDRLRIDGMEPFPSVGGYDGTGSMSSPFRQKYGEEFNPVPKGENAPEYILDAKGGDIFNLEDYAQRYLFWRNEHIAGFNNLVFATGPYEASALAYTAVLRELAHQVDHQRIVTLKTFQGYYDGEQNKRIENAIRLYQQRSFKKKKDIIPDDIKMMQKSPLTSCGVCNDRGTYTGSLQAPEGACLAKNIFPCGPQQRADGSVALNPFYLWNDEEELWKRRFQLMDAISEYMVNVRKVSLMQKNYGINHAKTQALLKKTTTKTGVFRGFWNALRNLISVAIPPSNSAATSQHNADAEAQQVAQNNGAAPPPPHDDQNVPTSGNHVVNNRVYIDRNDKAAIHAQNRAMYLSDNDVETRWDQVAEAYGDSDPKKFGYHHPVIKTEKLSDAQFDGDQDNIQKTELQYSEILNNGRWEKLYNDGMKKLVKDFGTECRNVFLNTNAYVYMISTHTCT
jgi:hypothetical protein